MEVGVGIPWYVMLPRMVAGVWAEGVFCIGAVIETGVVMVMSHPVSVKIRLMARISQKTEERCFKCFI